MAKAGWFSASPRRQRHYVRLDGDGLSGISVCGVGILIGGSWIETNHIHCEVCEEILEREEKGEVKMKKEGWYARAGIKVAHYVSTIDGKLALMALCGARQDPAAKWRPEGLHRHCKRCKAILKKKEKPEMQKEGWYSRKGMTVAHFVETCAQTDGGSEELLTSAMCGAHETSKESWKSIIEREPLPRCKRCLSAILKKRVTGAIEDFVEPTDMPKNPKAFDMQVQYSQVIGETIPLTWIPVPDVKVVIDLLKRGMDSESCKVSRGVTSAVIKELQVYINEAEERCSRPDTVTTWSHEGEEE